MLVKGLGIYDAPIGKVAGSLHWSRDVIGWIWVFSL